MLKKSLAILCIALFASYSGFAQNEKRALEVRQLIWGKSQSEYTTQEVPAKWKKESAVILFQDYSNEYTSRSNKFKVLRSFNERIALLDKAAVKRYSKFSFTEKSIERNIGEHTKRIVYLGFKVIKQDGTEEIVDMGEAVEVQSDKPFEEKKLAIPNLQVGDIIDYYFFEEKKIVTPNSYYAFSPVSTPIVAEYPIVYLKREFAVEKDFCISYKAINGAPDLEESEGDGLRIFSLEASNLDKVKDEIWMYPSHSLPTIKYQIFVAKREAQTSLNNFVGAAGEIKSEVKADELSKALGSILQSQVFYKKGFEKKLKSRNLQISDLNREELTYEIFFYIYDRHINKHMEECAMGDREKLQWPKHYLMGYFLSGLRKNKVPFRILIIPNREYTDFRDLLFIEELDIMIVVEAEEDLYFTGFSDHPTLNQIPGDFQNVMAYEVEFSADTKVNYFKSNDFPMEVVTTPLESYDKNKIKVDSKVIIAKDMTRLKFSNNYSILGLNRASYQSRLLVLEDYLQAEYDKYGYLNILDRFPTRTDFEENTAKLKDLKISQEIERRDSLIKLVERDYNIGEVEIESFDITSIGRRDNPLFAYDVSFNLGGLLKQAGANYLLEAGKLISNQYDIQLMNRERKADIYAPNPRSYDTAITVHIPDGYSVEGVDKLNMNVQNETGGSFWMLRWPLMR